MYNAPHQFEPLLPGPKRQQPLLAKAHDLARAATQLAGLPVAPELRALLRGMNSLGDRTAVSALSALVKRGLLKSDTPQGKVRFGLPLHALRFYFPALWPEAEADADAYAEAR